MNTPLRIITPRSTPAVPPCPDCARAVANADAWQAKALELSDALERMRPVIEAARAWQAARADLTQVPREEHRAQVQWGRRWVARTDALAAAVDHLDGRAAEVVVARLFD